MNALAKYLQREGRGAASDLARAVDVSHTAVHQWATGRIPAERLIDVERATGIPREILRPDLYQRAALLRPKAVAR